MADGPTARHALQFKGEVKSFSSKDILARLAAAQQRSVEQAATPSAAPPSHPARQPARSAEAHGLEEQRKGQVVVAQPAAADPKAGNFHALQYKGQVKKFTSGAVRAGSVRIRPRPLLCLDRMLNAVRSCDRCSRAAAQILNDFTRAAQGEQILPQRSAPSPPPAEQPSLVADVAPLIDFEQLAVSPQKAGAVQDDWADFLAGSEQLALQPPQSVAPPPPPTQQPPQPPPSVAAPVPFAQPPPTQPPAPPLPPASAGSPQDGQHYLNNYGSTLSPFTAAQPAPAPTVVPTRPAQVIPVLPPPPK